MIKYRDYIKSIYSKEISFSLRDENQKEYETRLENGFVINNYFITAAHVVENWDPFIKVDDRIIELSRDNLVIWRDMTKFRDPSNFDYVHCQSNDYYNQDNGDIAVYRIDGIKSPFILSKEMPAIGDSLVSYYYYKNRWHKASASVYEVKGNFFDCIMQPIHPTEGGSSGSPVIKNNIVYGLVSGGYVADKRICQFTSACFINKLLSQIDTNGI